MTVDPFTWLAECLRCGKVHPKRPVPGMPGFASAADPGDGHPYQPRHMTVEHATILREQYVEDMTLRGLGR